MINDKIRAVVIEEYCETAEADPDIHRINTHVKYLVHIDLAPDFFPGLNLAGDPCDN